MPTIVELHCICENDDLLDTILGLFGDEDNIFGNDSIWSSSRKLTQAASRGLSAWSLGSLITT